MDDVRKRVQKGSLKPAQNGGDIVELHLRILRFNLLTQAQAQ
jgi:hypothetical protein